MSERGGGREPGPEAVSGDSSTEPGPQVAPTRPRQRRIGLGTQILIGMVVGAVAGALLGERVTMIEPLGDLFIRLLMLVAVPLVFFILLAGVTALTDLRTFGRVAAKALTYFLLTTASALVLGFVTISTLSPGTGMTLTESVEGAVGAYPSAADVLLGLVPTNLFQAFVEGNVAQLVVVAVLLGVTTLFLPERPRDWLREAYSVLADLFRKLVDLILIVAPVGIGALMAVTVGRHGAELFGPLVVFLLGVWGAHLVMVCVYIALLALLTDRAPIRFLRDTGTVWATTLATTSSLASLSVALEEAERIELPRTVYSLTLPLGAQMNKDGTAIMLASVVLFTAQAAGVDFAFAQLLTIFLIGLMLSLGSGGIPGGGLVSVLIFVQAFGLPLEVAAIVGGIYRLIDMGNTTVNIMGDMVGTAIVAHSEARRSTGLESS
jgi:Na+/H+-dicarboxylate symporter